MQGGALPPPHQVAQIRYFVAALILGAAGSLVAVAAFGKGNYTVGPLVMKLEMLPSTSGVTELAVDPVRGLQSGVAEARTHMGFLELRGTVVGVTAVRTDDVTRLVAGRANAPLTLAETLRDEGEDAFRRFGLRIGWVTLAGGASGGLAIALFGMKARRILQGALGGLILIGALGIFAWQTYDIEEFSRVEFRRAGSAAPLQGG